MDNMQDSAMMQQQMPPNDGMQPMQAQDGAEPRKSRWWIWLIVILLLGAGAGYYFFLR
ncbi:MAG: hypothetical protein AABY15_03955 [Nanoarchaeota archaeon]